MLSKTGATKVWVKGGDYGKWNCLPRGGEAQRAPKGSVLGPQGSSKKEKSQQGKGKPSEKVTRQTPIVKLGLFDRFRSGTF